MEENWEQLKKEILAETKEVLSLDKAIDASRTVDLFLQVLTFPVEEAELRGVQTRIVQGFQKIFVEQPSRAEKNAYFSEVAKIESYLKKILYLVDRQKYESIKHDKKGLGATINVLELNPSKVEFSQSVFTPEHSKHFGDHLAKAYNLRNLESHNCTEWTNSRLYTEAKSVLVICLYATFRYYRQLKIAVNQFDFSAYLKTEYDNVKKFKTGFVQLDGKEKIAEVELYAREVLFDDEAEQPEEKQVSEAREGSIDWLMRTISEKQMVVVGEAGTGKTTTIEFLHLKDIEAAMQDDKHPIPIYILLKNMIGNDSLIDKIQKKLGLTRELAEDLLSRGRCRLYLDGLNEVEGKIKTALFRQINNLLNEFPLNFYFITSRSQHYNREFDHIPLRRVPVFQLQEMKAGQMTEFLDKNGRNVKDYILKEMNQQKKLMRIVQTPLMMVMLIAIVKKVGKVPEDKGKMVRAFMSGLYLREQQQRADFNKDVFHLMLCYLGWQSKELTGSNAGLDRDQYILPALAQRKQELGIQENLLDCLRIAVDLNILVNEENMYSFTHELYQEYYSAEYLHEVGN